MVILTTEVLDVLRQRPKVPLRYPGGKSRAVQRILQLIPEFDEYREPFVGGGSVFLAVKHLFPEKKYYINDLNHSLYLFWKCMKEEPVRLIKAINGLKKNVPNGRQLYLKLKNQDFAKTEFDKAVRFFILNRVTFSGLVDSGGFSKEAFQKRFTDSSIERIRAVAKNLTNVSISNEDYSEIIRKPGKNTFVFLDPPYLSNSDPGLYGRNGDLHKSFDHAKFAQDMKRCKHQWLITYDDAKEIRELFSFANIYSWKLQYGVNNGGKNRTQNSASVGRELFISNFELK